MELKHRFTVPAPIDETWAAFNDLGRVAPCFPGASLTSVDGDDFSGTVKIKLGPISMQYSGSGTFVERDQANHTARFEAKGKDKRGNGTAAATVTARLATEGDGTAVEVVTDLAITGKPAQFGRGVIQDVSDKLLGTFTTCLSTKLGPDSEADPVPAAPEPAAEPAPAPNPPESTPPPAPAAAAQSSGAAAGVGTSTPAGDEGLDLFRTVAPVLARRYALPAGAALLALFVLIRLIRR